MQLYTVLIFVLSLLADVVMGMYLCKFLKWWTLFPQFSFTASYNSIGSAIVHEDKNYNTTILYLGRIIFSSSLCGHYLSLFFLEIFV